MKTIVDYATKVKEQHALNKTLAPVETDLTDASRAYAIGEQFINDGDLFKAKTAIAQHDALVYNTNYEDADDITTQIKNKTVTTDPVPTEGSTNPVQSNGVYVENRNIYEVMGKMGAKNLIPYPHEANTETKAGITFTENADGSITVNGTATDIARHLITTKQFKAGEKYILSGCPSGGAHSPNGTYTLYTQTINNFDDGEGVEFTWNASITGITIAVYTGVTVDNLTFYPMLRLASDTDNTYQPYAETNQQLTVETQALANVRAELGAHNWLNLDDSLLRGKEGADTSYTFLPTGIEIANTVSDTFRVCSWWIRNLKPNTDYILSSDVTKVSGTGRMFIRDSDSSTFLCDTQDITTSKNVSLPFNTGAYTSLYIAIYSTTQAADIGDIKYENLLLRLADDTSTEYQPYAKTNQQLTAENQTLTNQANDMVNVLGAKNLLPNNAVSQTINGVTFTVNGDGSVTANGTASAYTQFNLNSGIEYKEGKYALNGCPSGGGSSTYVIWVRNLAITVGVTDGGNGATLNVTNADTFKASIVVYSGATVNNLTFYPMLRPASIQDDTYAPYSMTNREMTPYVQAISNPNLLDNPWFTVNQRGQSTYSVTGTTDTYTVDRWSMIGWSGKTVSFDVDASGIIFSSGVNSFRQRLYNIWDALVGKKLTLSIEYTSTVASGQIGIVKGGSWDTNTVINFKTGHNVDSVTFTAESGTSPILWVYVPETNTDFNIKAIKLELGSVSTLAMDTAPNYATELLKCQRYFQRIACPSTYALSIGQASSADYIRFPLTLACVMRGVPTLTVSDLTKVKITQSLGASAVSIHALNLRNASDKNPYINLEAQGSSLTVGAMWQLILTDSSVHLDLSADL